MNDEAVRESDIFLIGGDTLRVVGSVDELRALEADQLGWIEVERVDGERLPVKAAAVAYLRAAPRLSSRSYASTA